MQFIDPDSFQKSHGGKREGVEFTITNRAGFLAAIRANRAFASDTIFGGLHAGQVGANFFTVLDFRSYTSGSFTLGADTVGNNIDITRSLEIDVGPNESSTSDRDAPPTARGYADLDCSNPAQDIISFFKHLFGH